MPGPPVGYPRLNGAAIDAIIDATVQIATRAPIRGDLSRRGLAVAGTGGEHA